MSKPLVKWLAALQKSIHTAGISTSTDMNSTREYHSGKRSSTAIAARGTLHTQNAATLTVRQQYRLRQRM